MMQPLSPLPSFAVCCSCGVGVRPPQPHPEPRQCLSSQQLPVLARSLVELKTCAGDRTVTGLLGVQQGPVRPRCLQLRCRYAVRD